MAATPAPSRRGSTLVWTLVVLVCLTGFCSLGVEVGRVQLVKAELRAAADAAARHAAHTLLSSGNAATARSAAVSCAAENKADGSQPVALDSTADVRFGTWNPTTRQFTASAAGTESTATAVEVTARRTAARGNAVNLAFARMVGHGTSDVTARAIARINARRPGIVGLDYITMSGASGVGNVTNSYRSKAGAFSGSATTYGRGTIASNGNITLSGNTTINGDARPGPGMSVSLAGAASVTGSRGALAKPLDYPTPQVGTAATTNNNSQIPSAYIDGNRDMMVANAHPTLPGGTYYIDDLTVASSGSLSFSGAATVYMTGNLILKGAMNTTGSSPANLSVIGLTAATVELTSDSYTYMDCYAPLSAFRMSGSTTLLGSVVAKNVQLSGSANVIFDESLTVSMPAVSLVN